MPEAAHPYYVLFPHFKIDFASPKGPNPPIDQTSVTVFKDNAECVQFLQDETVKQLLQSAKKLTEVNVDEYEAIFYIGAHGPVLDLASDSDNAKLASEFFQAGKIVSAVCHAPAALIGAVDADGKSIFQGREVTAFSNAEEAAVDYVKDIPFLPEDKIKALGGRYVKAEGLWQPKVVVDGTLITGQNPSSSASIGKAILQALQK